MAMLFLYCTGFSRQEYWSALPVSSPVDQASSGPISRDVPFGCSVELDDLPGDLAAPLQSPVSIESSLAVGCQSTCSRGSSKGPAGVAGKRVWGRLELMLYHTQEQRALPSHHCHWLPWSPSAAQESLSNMDKLWTKLVEVMEFQLS